ncbi:hypothetical protein WDW37_08600 [Bdellovibrionota bacterium FG-1]
MYSMLVSALAFCAFTSAYASTFPKVDADIKAYDDARLYQKVRSTF